MSLEDEVEMTDGATEILILLMTRFRTGSVADKRPQHYETKLRYTPIDSRGSSERVLGLGLIWIGIQHRTHPTGLQGSIPHA